MTITKEEIGEVVKATVEGFYADRPQVGSLATYEPTADQLKIGDIEALTRALQSLRYYHVSEKTEIRTKAIAVLSECLKEIL